MIEIKDSSFISPEGLKVGMDYSKLSGEIEKTLEIEPGYGRYLKLQSGWLVDLSVSDIKDLSSDLNNCTIIGFRFSKD